MDKAKTTYRTILRPGYNTHTEGWPKLRDYILAPRLALGGQWRVVDLLDWDTMVTLELWKIQNG